MSKKMLSFIYLSVFILACIAFKALTNKENEKDNKEDAYSSVTNDNTEEENGTTYDYIILN